MASTDSYAGVPSCNRKWGKPVFTREKKISRKLPVKMCTGVTVRNIFALHEAGSVNAQKRFSKSLIFIEANLCQTDEQSNGTRMVSYVDKCQWRVTHKLIHRNCGILEISLKIICLCCPSGIIQVRGQFMPVPPPPGIIPRNARSALLQCPPWTVSQAASGLSRLSQQPCRPPAHTPGWQARQGTRRSMRPTEDRTPATRQGRSHNRLSRSRRQSEDAWNLHYF